MKITREARSAARKLFHSCLVDGRLDEDRMRALIRRVAEAKPRRYLAILSRIRALVAIEVEKRTYRVESAVELPDKGEALFAELGRRFGAPLATRYAVDPKLLGGVVIRVGSAIWDGSIRQRLRSIAPATH